MFFNQLHFPSVCIADPHDKLSQKLFWNQQSMRRLCLCVGLFGCQLGCAGWIRGLSYDNLVKDNLTFAQYIVFTEEMYKSVVKDNADDFPKVAVDTNPTVVIGVKFVSTFVDGGDQSFVPTIGEDAMAKDDVKEF